MAKRVIPDNQKPVIGIIYSESENLSNESRHVACYLAGALVSTGYAKVALVGFRADGLPSDLFQQRNSLDPAGVITVLPPGKTSLSQAVSLTVSTVQSVTKMGAAAQGVSELSASSSIPQIAFCHWNELQHCDVIVVTVNSVDTTSCGAKLAQVLMNRSTDLASDNVVVFSLQRGVRNGGMLKDE
jgi:hypothetical protein